MATLRERLEYIISVNSKNAVAGLNQVGATSQTAFGKLKADVAAADGVMGKAKVAANGLGSALSAYAAPAAATAAVAFADFARRSVQAFQETALAAGQFSDATGIAVEDASRWIAVGDDFGISAESIQGAFMRMNRAVASGAFDKYGIDIKRAADGTVDANATFQAAVTAIGAIPDATKRAQVAQEVFGRGYASIARIMEMDAKSLADALGSVSEGQIIDPEERAKARQLQAALDNLSDAGRELMLALGEGLVPSLAEVASGLASVINQVNKLDNAVDGLIYGSPLIKFLEKVGIISTDVDDAVDGMSDTMSSAADSMDLAADSADDLRQSQEDLYDSVMAIADGRRAFEAAIDGYEQALGELGGTMLDTESTTEDVEDATRSAADAAINAAKEYATMEGAALNSQEGQDRLREALGYLAGTLDPNSPLRRALDTYVSDLNSIPTERTTRVRVEYLPGGPTIDENQNLRPGLRSGTGFGFDASTDIAGRSADGRSAGGRTAIMRANELWQQALQLWGGKSGNEALKEKFRKELERARRKYEVGDYGAAAYFRKLSELQEKYKWPRLSEEWMAIWREMDSLLSSQDVDLDGSSASAGSAAGGSMASSGGGGSVAGLAMAGAGRRVTNINIELRGLFIGSEAEMRRAVRPLVPAISRELDKYERSQG